MNEFECGIITVMSFEANYETGQSKLKEITVHFDEPENLDVRKPNTDLTIQGLELQLGGLKQALELTINELKGRGVKQEVIDKMLEKFKIIQPT